MTCGSPWYDLRGWRSARYQGAGIACWLERRARDRQVASSSPGRSGGRIVFFRVNSLCWLLFVVRATPCYAVARKRFRSFCQKCRWQVITKNAYTLDPTKSDGLTMLFRHSVGTYQGNEPTRNSSGIPDHSHRSSLSCNKAERRFLVKKQQQNTNTIKLLQNGREAYPDCASLLIKLRRRWTAGHYSVCLNSFSVDYQYRSN